MSQPESDAKPPVAEKPALTSPAPEAKPSQKQPDQRPAGTWLNPALVVAIVALATALGLFWHAQERMQEVELQLARRIGEFDTSSREARTAAHDAGAVLGELSARLTVLENRAQETQSEQLSLTSMYQELARSQDERVVADIEQTLLLAQQQLQLAGNVRAALIGMEAAEARLVHLGKPQFANLQKAIASDIERLKLLPAADVAGLSARLDVLVQNVDRLKLETESEEAPPAKAAPPAVEGTVDSLERMTRQVWEDIKQLVRVRRLDKPETPLLAPKQNWFLRENLKLRLLAARLAILSRDEDAYRADLTAARVWVANYFSPHDPLTQSVQDSMQELAALPIRMQEADIGESLKALRELRGVAVGQGG